MLQFITGKKGSGKTTCLHSLLGKYVKEENCDAVLIVPKHFTFESDTGILKQLGPKDACRVEVLSFSRLAHTVLKTCRGIKKPPLEDGANAVIMSLALDGMKDRLKVFSKHISTVSFVEKMLSQIKDFKKNLITPEELEKAARALPDGTLKEKALETALIYRAYNAVLQQSFYDDNDLLSIVYDILLESDYFENKVVAIDGFSRFTAQERRLISLMMRQARAVYITACTENSQSTDASSPFAAVNATVRRIKNEAAKYALGCAPDISLCDRDAGFTTYRHKELYALEKNLYHAQYVPYTESVQAVTLLCCRTVRDECDAAARQIKKLMRTGEYRCRDIAVVYRDEKVYEKEIRHSLVKYGVPVFEDKRQPIENEPLVIFIRSLLSVCAEGISTENIIALCKTGLWCVSADETASVENYALMWSLKGRDWQRDWTENPDGFGIEMNEKRQESLKELNEIREKTAMPLLRFRESTKDVCGKEFIKMLYLFLRENGVDERLKQYALALEETGNFDLAKEQEQVWDIMMNVLDKLAVTVSDRKIPVKRLCEIFDLTVSTQSLGKLPDGFDEVYICSCERITTKTPKVVFVMGANDGVFPAAYKSQGVFATVEKERLKASLPDYDDGAAQAAIYERFLVYGALCSAREKLYVSWSLANTAGETLTPSQIVYDIKKILPRVETVNTAFLKEEELIESEKAAFELMAAHWNENSPKENALKKYFFEKEEYKGKMRSLERLAEKKSFAFENAETAKELFGVNMRLSASRLEDYELCPFKYFLKHEMRVQPRKIARLDPAQSGTLVHYVLENLLKMHKAEGITAASKETLKAQTKALLDDYIETHMGGIKDKTKRFTYLYFRTLKTLDAILDRLLFEFSESDFEPCDFELHIDRSGEIQPFKVELEDGYIELCGIVDRVDKMEKNGNCYIRVVDYKTGVKKFSLSDVLGGLGMQMLLYLVSIWRNGSERYGENIVPAGVLYLPARLEAFAVDRNDSKEAVFAKKLSGGKLDGMILDDGDVIKGMDRSLSGVMIPVKLSKSGALSGSFISLAQLGKLAEKMDALMAQMGNELHKGKIPARPVFGKDHGTTCDFCDYAGICMRQESTDIRYLEKRKHDECLAILEGGDG